MTAAMTIRARMATTCCRRVLSARCAAAFGQVFVEHIVGYEELDLQGSRSDFSEDLFALFVWNF
jgi:hypothetical protein